MASLRQNTWETDTWYGQYVAGDVEYGGEKQLWVWGASGEGALGLNDQSNRSSPTQLPAGPGTNAWTSFISGYTAGSATNANNADGNQTMFAIKNNTELWAWGMNERGEIPINTADSYSSPKQIPGSWDKVYQMKWGGAAINTLGELWIWGDNIKGQLGQAQKPSTVFGYSSPVQVPGSWSTLRPDNANAMLAFKTDGTLWGWGSGGFGSLAQNNQTQYSSPVQISGTDWSHFPKGGGYGVSPRVFKTDGSLWGWGSTSYGQLGQNTSPQGGTERFSSPVQIGSGAAWSTISNASGSSSGLMRKTNGELWVTGQNNIGQLGLNSTVRYSSPVQMGTDTNWSDNVFSNEICSGGVKTDGTMWLWGRGDAGSFGLNHRETIAPGQDYVSSPVQLPGSWPGVLGSSIAQGHFTTYFMKNL